ncbi:MAG: M48 family metalloprotease [Syntrophales bacterium]|nr:M48 family metalloprotease [Syntrophales bacterium]
MNLSNKSKKILLSLLFFLVLTFPTRAYPDFTIEDERRIGKEIYEKLSREGLLLKDERVNQYITSVGNKVLTGADRVLFDFKFLIVQSSAINAFATPGGYVYVNAGLINLCETESELASVLAHEIAHVNSRHIADIVSKTRKISMAALAGILTGVLLGGGGDLSAAITGFSYATAATMYLRYSREHEEEADRLGMSYLVNAGYNPGGMLSLLRSMRKYEYYSNTVPSYFLTHPGTDERIRYLDSLLQTSYTGNGKTNLVGNFKRIQTLLLLSTCDWEGIRRRFTENLKKDHKSVDDLFGLAVTEQNVGHFEESINLFKQALSLAPQDVDILRSLGIVYHRTGKIDDAIHYLKESLKYDDRDPKTIVYLGLSYEAKGDLNQAVETLNILRENHTIQEADLYYQMAGLYGRAGKKYQSHYYFAQYFKKKKRLESALFHLGEALKYCTDDSKIEQLKKEMENLKQENVRTK